MQMKKYGSLERRATRSVFLLCGMAQSAWAPLVPYAKARVHVNDRQFGLLLLCFGVGSLLSMPVIGRLASRYGCRRLIQMAAGAIFIGLLAVAVAPSATLLAVSLFLFGVSIGAIDVVMNVQALLVERGSGENLMPGFHGFYSIGGFAGALLMSGLLWLNATAELAAFVIVMLLALLLASASSALLPYGDDREEARKKVRGFPWPAKYVLLLAGLAFLVMLAEGSMLDWSALFLVDRVGMMEKEAGIGFTAFSIAMTISRFSGSFVLRHLGRRRTVTAGALLAAGGFLLVILSATPVGSIVGFALVGLGAANLVPVFFSLASELGGGLGSNVAFVSTVGYTGVLTGPVAIGFVVHAKGFGLAFGGVACSLIVVAIFAPLAIPSQRTR